MNVEQLIKSRLDGNLFSVDPETGRTLTKKVSRDFIPKYKPVPAPDSSGPHNNMHIWTDEEDETVITLRSQRKKWADIGLAVGVSATLAINRYNLLCQQRGLKPVSNEETRTWAFPQELRERVVSLRLTGMPFKEIAALVGLKVTQVEHVFIRWRRNKSQQGQAA
jgi:hypothetical protein